jgi:hypothetical protein
MVSKHFMARNLAAAFLAESWSADELLQRGEAAWGHAARWLPALVRRLLATFDEAAARADWESLAAFIESDAGFNRAWQRFVSNLTGATQRVFWVRPNQSRKGAAIWNVPALPTTAALANWLSLKPAELDWFADIHGGEANVPAGPLRHYTYQWLPKVSGKWRLLEMPKRRLKAIQRRILHEILDQIPQHDGAHGYRRGRSIATFAAPHCGHSIVLRFDLRQFFPSVRRSRVHRVFHTAGYPADVARLLTGLCTNVVPQETLGSHPDAKHVPWTECKRYQSPHLPQGAPTSPALANLCAYLLDCRLDALGQKVGANYTRYADDLAFSGGAALERLARRFQVAVCRIALEEGFEVHTRKSRFMRQGVRQQLVGVVVNAHPNVRRRDYDRLKAILHNCARHGPDSQNREGHCSFRAHLLGRIAHVRLLNAERGQRLQNMFDKIRWDSISHGQAYAQSIRDPHARLRCRLQDRRPQCRPWPHTNGGHCRRRVEAYR